MKILILHQYFLESDDGGGSRWNEMSRMWSCMGHDITVISGMMHANGTKKREEYKGRFFVKKTYEKITIWRSHVSEAYNKNFLGRLWGYFSFMFSSLWCGLFLAEGKYDAVIVTSPPLFIGFSGYLVSRWKRAPLIFEVRDLWPESAIDTGVLRNKLIIKIAYAFERFVYKKARLINVLTPAFLANLRDVKKVPEGKLLMIPNASDFSLSEEVMREFNRVQFRNEHDLDNYFVITYVGAHGVANHLEQVIYAAETLKDTNALFVLIGQGMEKERLRALASEKKLKNIRFFDAVPKREVFKFILASDMGLSVLKKVDTFKTVYSNKTFDYMSCKRPILMAIDGVSRQLVEEAKAGSYIEPENIMEYNTVIRNYLNNPSRAIAEGKNGYLFARSNFDRQILSEKYLDRINKVIK